MSASTPSRIPPSRTAASSATAALANTAFSVEFRSVGRSFTTERKGRHKAETKVVLRNVSLTVAPGEVIAILGASGCGKSTLLRIAGGLASPTTGDALIDGSAVGRFDSRCAVGFQEPRLLPWRDLTGNVSLGLPRGLSKTEGRERVAQLLDLVGLSAAARLRPREVSGGMAQRASLARALARNPGVLLLDEPFGALDALTRLQMQDLLLDVHAAAPTTVLLVTHDVDEALQLADRVVLLGRPENAGTEDAGTEDAAAEGATVIEILEVPGARPRDRGSAELAELRGRLLAGLGINRHGDSRGIEQRPSIPVYPF